MAIIIKTKDELDWDNGNKFTYVFVGNGLTENQIINLSLCVGDNDIFITGIEFTGSSSLITWNWYSDTQLDLQSGTDINEIKMNQTVERSSGTSFKINPNISDLGVKVIDGDIDSIGMNASNGLVKLQEKILSTSMAILRNTNNTIRIVNRHVGTCNLEVTITLSRMDDKH